MRQFDIRNSWLDNEGNPLVGRIWFFRKGTTVPEDITDAGGTPLANPVFTNNLGQPASQVFLEDGKDYTVQFEKYVGEGDMSDDTEITNWLWQYSCTDLWDVYGIQIDCDGVQAVDTVEDMKAFDPSLLGRNMLEVLGYSELADCPPVYYYWDPDYVGPTDGGSAIASDVATGAWRLVPSQFGGHIDVRHFGVFGAQTRQLAEPSMGAQILKAQAYATSLGKGIYFPSIDGDSTWYNLATVQAVTDGKFDYQTYVFDDTLNPHWLTVTPDSELNLYGDAVFHLISDTVRTMWGRDAANVYFEPTRTLVIDSAVTTANRTVSGVTVISDVLISGWTFDNCDLSELDGRLYSDDTFTNCRLTQRMFWQYQQGGFTVDDTCLIDVGDFRDMTLYMDLRGQQTSNLIDMQGKAVTSMPPYSSVSFRNAVFVNAAPSSASQIWLDGCSGSLVLETQGVTVNVLTSSVELTLPTQITSLSANQSNITLTLSPAIRATGSISLDKSVLVGGQSFYCETLSCDLSTLTAPLSANNAAIARSTVNRALYVYGTLAVTDSMLYSPIRQAVTASPLVCNVIRCVFGPEAFHGLSSSVSGTAVTGNWVDNVYMGTGDMVQITRSGFDSDDTAHSYTFRNNVGTCESDWTDLVHFTAVGDAKRLQYRDSSPVTEQGWLEFIGRNTTGNAGTTDPAVYLTEFKLFTIGTENVGPLAFYGDLATGFTEAATSSDRHVKKQSILSNTVRLGQESVPNNGASPWDGEHAGTFEYEGTPAGYVKAGTADDFVWRVTDARKLFSADTGIDFTSFTADCPVRWHIVR